MSSVLTDDLIDALLVFHGKSEEGAHRFARAIEQAVLQSEQVLAWKQDAERLNWIESEYGADIMCMETEEWEVGVIDYYAVGGTMREALDAAIEKQL